MTADNPRTGPVARQQAIYSAGMAGRRPRVPVAETALEAAAQRRMAAADFAYIAGGAGRESTMAANRHAFERWRIVPRMLRDVAHRDTAISLFGRRYPQPFLLCPIGKGNSPASSTRTHTLGPPAGLRPVSYLSAQGP